MNLQSTTVQQKATKSDKPDLLYPTIVSDFVQFIKYNMEAKLTRPDSFLNTTEKPKALLLSNYHPVFNGSFYAVFNEHYSSLKSQFGNKLSAFSLLPGSSIDSLAQELSSDKIYLVASSKPVDKPNKVAAFVVDFLGLYSLPSYRKRIDNEISYFQ